MPDDEPGLVDELMRFRPEGMTANAWAVKAGVSRTIWADLRRHGNPSRRTLSKLLEAAGSSLAEFEALRVGGSAQTPVEAAALAERGRVWRHAPLEPLPLLAAEPAGAWAGSGTPIELFKIDHATVIDRLQRPASLAAERSVYAVTIIGDSMWPRFRKGRRIAVSPSAPISAGDDVLVLLAEGALTAELERKTPDAVGLRQFNPPAAFDIRAASIQGMHKVLGELI